MQTLAAGDMVSRFQLGGAGGDDGDGDDDDVDDDDDDGNFGELLLVFKTGCLSDSGGLVLGVGVVGAATKDGAVCMSLTPNGVEALELSAPAASTPSLAARSCCCAGPLVCGPT